MRTRLGTKSRLAAHLTALVLLILMLVYVTPPPAPSGTDAPPETAAREETEPAGVPAEPADVAGRTASGPRPAEPAPLPEKTETPAPAPADDRTAASEPASPAAPAGAAASYVLGDDDSVVPSEIAPVPAPASGIASAIEEALAGLGATTIGSAPGDEPEPAPPAEEPAAPAAGDDLRPPPAAPEKTPIAPQPDESGAMVVAPSETGLAAPATPLPDASLEVMGDNVFWLDPRRDLERELAAIPDVGVLVLLAPLPGYRVGGFEHIRTEVIPADLDDLSDDAAARFLHVTADPAHPVVVAALPGARGAAFFKGVYLLVRRNLDVEALRSELAPELEEAGDAADAIVHRLRRLDPDRLR